MKSVVKRVGGQLHKALSEKGLALLVNHGISEDKVEYPFPNSAELFVGNVSFLIDSCVYS